MKKVLVLITISLILFALAGCDLLSTISTAATTTIEIGTGTDTETTNQTTNQTTTTDTTLFDTRPSAIEAEFDRIEPLIPEAIIADRALPATTDPSITVEYSIDGTPIGMTLVYSAPPTDVTLALAVTLTYGDLAVTRTYSILMLRDYDAYQEYLRDLGFSEIEALIEAGLPDEAKSDFTLPIISYNNAEVSYTTPVSRIYHGRFVFTFPSVDVQLVITSRVIYMGQTRYFTHEITLKGFYSLSRIPELYILTSGNQEVTSKDYYIGGVATLVTYDENNVAHTVFSNRTLEIRSRGNSTLWMPKRPYKIKFTNKTALLTEYEAKDWVLLANFADQTLIRNKLAIQLANAMGMPYTPSANFVEVYMNNAYIGNYMVTDQIEVSSVRIDIEEDSSAADTGYLLEWDLRQFDSWQADGEEGVAWFNIYGIAFAIKSPQPDGFYYNQAQFDYIYNYMLSVHLALKNKQSYTGLIDEASFIDWFIVQEVFKNVDSGYSSNFYYKDKGGLLKMGPIWDFDLSSTNPGHLDYENRMPPGWYTPQQYKNVWFYYLMKYEVFREHLKNRWNDVYADAIAMLESVYPESDAIARSRYSNFQRWDIIGKNYEWYTSTEVYEAKTYEEQLALLYDWLEARIAWMDEAINDPDFV
ncbi:MAG: hypothetical protein A2Y16_01225 [Tenericutes bacterium GWF2_57_13]|nr:MAG: hypothetical protein A2Y16_01225 [Tenericutes bacterium GWF2_57_13]